MKQLGFSLLETLIAMTLLSIMSGMIILSLQTALNATHVTAPREAQRLRINQALTLFHDDIKNMLASPLIHDPPQSMLYSEAHRMRFMIRSDIEKQRIEYRYLRHSLTRQACVLKRNTLHCRDSIAILTHIQSLQFNTIDKNNRMSTHYQNSHMLPRAVQLSICMMQQQCANLTIAGPTHV